LQGALVTLGVILDFLSCARATRRKPPICCATPRTRCGARRGSADPAGYRPKRLQARQSFVLQGCWRGPERAAALLVAFGSVAGVFAADEQALAQVPGSVRAPRRSSIA